ncbi:MAG: hypothetical protein Q4B96_04305 [Bacillota bacterium]|nr:hypothetical protein [Bacillota bacterium]
MNPFVIILIAVFLLFLTLGVVAVTPAFFDYRVGIPLSEDYDRANKLMPKYANGNLTSLIRRRNNIRIIMLAVLTVGIIGALSYGSSVKVAMLTCAVCLAGLFIPLLNSFYTMHPQNPQMHDKFRQKYGMAIRSKYSGDMSVTVAERQKAKERRLKEKEAKKNPPPVNSRKKK